MGYKVLIADDMADVRSLLRVIIDHDPDFEVVAEAENGLQASLLAAAHQPDLILSDMEMPVQNGLEAIKQIRGTCVDAKVIVLSGFARWTQEDALAAGADRCIEKSSDAFSRVLDEARAVLGIETAGDETISATA
jgi:two-component system, NarL family, invasion response regulator UvrY